MKRETTNTNVNSRIVVLYIGSLGNTQVVGINVPLLPCPVHPQGMMELGGAVYRGDLNLNPSSTTYYFLASDYGFLIYKTETMTLPVCLW